MRREVYGKEAEGLAPSLGAYKQGTTRNKNLGSGPHEIRREDNRNPAGGPPIGAYRGGRREDVAVGQLCGPIAPGDVVPVRFLKESNAARRVVMEEPPLLIVERGRVIEKPPGIPDQEGGRRSGNRGTMRRNEIRDGGVAA